MVPYGTKHAKIAEHPWRKRRLSTPQCQWKATGCLALSPEQPACCPTRLPPSHVKNRLDLSRLAELDRQFCEFASLQRHAVPRCGWTKTIRLALGMSSKALGSRLGMSGQGVRKLEQAEADGSITLKTLARLASGLDCEVRYVLVPRTSLVEQVLARAQEVSGNALPVTPLAGIAFQENDALKTLTMVLLQVNKRGFW